MKWLTNMLANGIPLFVKRTKGRPQHGKANKQPPVVMPFEPHRAEKPDMTPKTK